MPELLADRQETPGVEHRHLGDVPVPQGERSMTPVHVDGTDQSSSPVETVTTFRRECPRVVGRTGQLPDRDPGEPRLDRVDDRQLLASRGLDHLRRPG